MVEAHLFQPISLENDDLGIFFIGTIALTSLWWNQRPWQMKMQNNNEGKCRLFKSQKYKSISRGKS